MANNGTGITWDENHPTDSEPAQNGPVEITDVRKGVNRRIKKEHVTFAEGDVGGEHKQGSAVAYRQTAAPTKRPDGATDLDAVNDIGRMWVDDNDVLRYGKDAGAVFSWTPIVAATVQDNAITLAKLHTSLVAKLNTEIQADAGVQPWMLRVGSARPYFGNYADGYPTMRPDGSALAANDYGRLAIDWNDPKGQWRMKAWSGIAWGDIAAFAVASGVIGHDHLDAALAALVGVRVYNGFWVGNGAGSQDVALPFTPIAVVGANATNGNLFVAFNSWGNKASINGNVPAAGLSFLGNKFQVNTAALNTNGTQYHFLAFKANS